MLASRRPSRPISPTPARPPPPLLGCRCRRREGGGVGGAFVFALEWSATPRLQGHAVVPSAVPLARLLPSHVPSSGRASSPPCGRYPPPPPGHPCPGRPCVRVACLQAPLARCDSLPVPAVSHPPPTHRRQRLQPPRRTRAAAPHLPEARPFKPGARALIAPPSRAHTFSRARSSMS